MNQGEELIYNKSNIGLTVLQTLLALCLATVVVFQSIATCCFDFPFYQQNFRNLGTAKHVDVSEDELETALKVLLDYLNGKRDDINLTVRLTSNQETVEMYNEREIAHMVDVRALWQLLLKLKRVLIIVSVLIICGLFLPYLWQLKFYLTNNKLAKMQTAVAMRKFSYFWRSMRRSACYSLLIIALFVGLIAWLASSDFSSFWWHFHELLFSNDLWQLDPNTSRMVNLVDGQFFDNLVHYILQTTTASLAGLYLLLLLFPSICLYFIQKWHKTV